MFSIGNSWINKGDDTINIKNLNEGMVIKNYKELCAILEIEVKAGNTKKAQLKEINRFICYEKKGNKFIINQVYDEPLPKEDKRDNGNNSIYSENIQKLILHYLSTQKNNKVELSCSKFLSILDMVNDNYRKGRSDIDKLSHIISVEKKFIYDFYSNTQSSLKSKLETALNKLTRRSLITWKRVFIVAKEEITIILNQAGTPLIEDGRVIYHKINKFERATDKEERHIINIERNIMLEMGFDDKKDVFLKGEYNNFRKKVEHELRNGHNIQFYYYAYEILYNIEHIIPLVDDDVGTFISMVNLNKDIIDGLNNSCTNRHNKALEKYKHINRNYLTNEYCRMILDDEYINKNEVLIEKLIRYGGKKLSI